MEYIYVPSGHVTQVDACVHVTTCKHPLIVQTYRICEQFMHTSQLDVELTLI